MCCNQDSDTISDVDYADDQVLFVSTPAQAKTLLLSLEPAARGTDLYINSDETEFKCCNQDGVIYSLNSKLLKLIEQFIYLGINITSTKSDVNIRIGKAWTASDRLTAIWKTGLSY